MLPLLPIIQPHPPPDPLRQGSNFTEGGAELVVLEPAADVEVQLADDGLNVVSAVAAGDFSNPLLEAVMRLGFAIFSLAASATLRAFS